MLLARTHFSNSEMLYILEGTAVEGINHIKTWVTCLQYVILYSPKS